MKDFLKKLMLGAIRFYQRYISPGLPPRCRFVPTCSQYALEAIEKYGPLKGGFLALKRFCDATPFTRGICMTLCPEAPAPGRAHKRIPEEA